MKVRRVLAAWAIALVPIIALAGSAQADNPNFAPHTPAQIHQVKVERNADITAAKKTYKATVAANAVKAPTMPSPKAWQRTADFQAKEAKKDAINDAKAKYDRTLSGSLHNTYGFTQ